ncbi:MAG: arylsulfatase A-like enzyme [Myxococcota bacterium]|jgi:arylsulfatase A-like enzyme
MRRRTAALLLLGLLGTAGSCLWFASVWLSPRPPNIVLVLGCTVRRDQTTPYGGPASTTPFLAELAAEGTRFADTVGASTWTRESSAAVLTGRHALSLGLPEPSRRPSQRILPEEATLLAEVLRDAGFHTVGRTANPNLNAQYGMAQGFVDYGDTDLKGFALRNKLYGEDVVDALLERVDARDGAERRAPLFLQAVLIDAHTPRAPATEEQRRFAEPGLPDLVRDYRAMLRRMDEAVRQLDDGLQKRGFTEENTLFVFVTDHGEGLQLPVHHRGGHGKMAYPSTAAIAWILRGPGIPVGREVPGLASQVDLLPTVLGLAGLSSPEPVAGQDLSRAVWGYAAETGRERAYTSSWFHGANISAIWSADRQCQRDHGSVGTDDHPLRQGCFDRVRDPDFRRPPFEDVGLLGELDSWRAARVSEWEAWEIADADPSAATRSQLEILGYTE